MSKSQGGSGNNRTMQEMQRQIAQLQRESVQLLKELGNVAQANSLENKVEQGLREISVQLAPLRDMGSRRKYPGDSAMKRFAAIQKAIAQPRWRGPNFEVDPPAASDRSRRRS